MSTNSATQASSQASSQARLSAVDGPRVLDEDRGLILTRSRVLLAIVEALGIDLSAADLWRVGPIGLADLPQDARELEGVAAREGLCPEHAGQVRPTDPLERRACRACEIGRVAWFARRPIDLDDAHPVTIDTGFGPFVPDWLFTDGNHRLLAWTLTGRDEWVTVAVDGDWDRGLALLVDERAPEWVFDNI